MTWLLFAVASAYDGEATVLYFISFFFSFFSSFSIIVCMCVWFFVGWYSCEGMLMMMTTLKIYHVLYSRHMVYFTQIRVKKWTKRRTKNNNRATKANKRLLFQNVSVKVNSKLATNFGYLNDFLIDWKLKKLATE